MNPNPVVYGNPETWDFSFINGGLETEAAKALKIQKAKVPKWDYEGDEGYWTSQLRIGITAGNITQNVPIDKTVCAVGMGRDCPFAEIGYFRRSVSGGVAGDVGLDSIVRVGNGVVNGFLWEMRDDASAGVYNLLSAGGGQIDEKQMTYRTWAPSSDNERNTSKQNGNYFIAPYTYYQLKTFIASIQVYVCNSADIPDNPEDITEVPQATWRSLDDWKNNYSTHKIIGFRERAGVYSLSKSQCGFPDRELIWAHYADSHKGFCIEYDIDKLQDSEQFVFNVNTTTHTKQK